MICDPIVSKVLEYLFGFMLVHNVDVIVYTVQSGNILMRSFNYSITVFVLLFSETDRWKLIWSLHKIMRNVCKKIIFLYTKEWPCCSDDNNKCSSLEVNIEKKLRFHIYKFVLFVFLKLKILFVYILWRHEGSIGKYQYRAFFALFNKNRQK